MKQLEIDLRTTRLTMRGVIEVMGVMQRDDPGREYYIDGDLYAVVSEERRR